MSQSNENAHKRKASNELTEIESNKPRSKKKMKPSSRSESFTFNGNNIKHNNNNNQNIATNDHQNMSNTNKNSNNTKNSNNAKSSNNSNSGNHAAATNEQDNPATAQEATEAAPAAVEGATVETKENETSDDEEANYANGGAEEVGVLEIPQSISDAFGVLNDEDQINTVYHAILDSLTAGYSKAIRRVNLAKQDHFQSYNWIRNTNRYRNNNIMHGRDNYNNHNNNNNYNTTTYTIDGVTLRWNTESFTSGDRSYYYNESRQTLTWVIGADTHQFNAQTDVFTTNGAVVASYKVPTVLLSMNIEMKYD